MPMLNALVFDPVTHEYKSEGIRVPSVTQILRDSGVIEASNFCPEAAMQKGTFVHQACEYDDAGDLDESALDPAILPYVEAWRRFKRELQVKVQEVERRVFHQPLFFAGTLDRILSLNGRDVLVDLKTGQPSPWHSIQTAMYHLAMRWEEPTRILDRAALYLSSEGTYRYCPHGGRTDFDVAKAAVTLAAWRRNA